MATKREVSELRIRIVGRELPGRECGPYREVRVGLQLGKQVVDAVDADAARATWETSAQVSAGVPRGPAVHGQRGERFLYLSWSGREGHAPAAMFRRAKLQLDAVGAELLAAALAPGFLLEGELGLTDAKGMPLCASVRPPLIRWRATPASTARSK